MTLRGRYTKPEREQIARRLRRLVWLSLVMLGAGLLLGGIGHLDLQRSASIAFPAGGAPDFANGPLWIFFASVLLAIAVGMAAVVAPLFLFFHRFSLRRLLIGVTAWAVVIAGWLALLRQEEFPTVTIGDGEIQFFIEANSSAYCFTMPLWLFPAAAALPLAPLIIYLLWPVRRS